MAKTQIDRSSGSKDTLNTPQSEQELRAPQGNATLDRYFLVLEVLEVAPRFKTTQQICEFLISRGDSVTERTVQRILNYYADHFQTKLVCRNKPEVAGRPPKEWAWSKAEGPPQFGDIPAQNALTLQLASELLKPILPASYLDDISRDLKRARQALGQIGSNSRKIPQKLAIFPRGQSRLPATVDSEILSTLFTAILTEKKVSANYTSGSGEKQRNAQYILNPLGLICRFDSFYLVHTRALEESKQGSANVEEWLLHRFKVVNIRDEKVTAPDGFDLAKHCHSPGFSKNTFTPELSQLGAEFEIELLFRKGTANYVMERPFSNDQTYRTQDDGRVLITATVKNNRELITDLRDFADDVEVLSPQALRTYFAGVSKTLYERYHRKEEC